MSSIAVVADSGSGKSSSYGQIPEIGIKGLDPKETVVVNVAGKDLPFRGWRKSYKGLVSEGGNLIESSDAVTIAKAITYISENRKEIKSVIIDDKM